MVNSIRNRALTLLQTEQDSKVPESCSVGYSYDEETNLYHFPILTEPCLAAILKQPSSHILTAGDLGVIGEWWSKNNEDATKYNDGSAWSILQGAYLSELSGSPLASAPDEDFALERAKLPTEDISNQISASFNFLTNPDTWIGIGGLIVGGLMIAYALPRVSGRL